MWIADTGASKNLTGDSSGMTNLREAKNAIGFTMGDGGEHKPKLIGDCSGMRCNKHGKTLVRAR